jgi:hypothetical protein
MDVTVEKDKLKEAIVICSTHIERINFAYSKINNLLPLSLEVFQKLEPETTSFIDQLIFRFSKLQDSMGNKLFPSLLTNLGEEVRAVPFIDLINKLESLELLKTSDWLLLRETRNILSHEYPFDATDIVDGLNLLHEQLKLIISIWEKLEQYVYQRYPDIETTI